MAQLLRRQLMLSAALALVFSQHGDATGTPPLSTGTPPVIVPPFIADEPFGSVPQGSGNFMGNPPAGDTAIVDGSDAPTDANFAGTPSSRGEVTLRVEATEFFGNELHYRWRVTDGQVVDQDSPTTTWTLADGPGIHLAYVLVSNGLGGYTEGRIAVNTDANPSRTPAPRGQYEKAMVAETPTATSAAERQIIGTVILSDASSCGVRNPFFGVNVNAVVELRNSAGERLVRAVLDPYSFNFAIDDHPDGTVLSITCEDAEATFTNFTRSVIATDGNQVPVQNIFILQGTSRPAVRAVTAEQNGQQIGFFPLTPTVRIPSDFLIGRLPDKLIGTPSRFLAYKGLDTRKGSCEYYKAVGLVEDCDAAGNYVGRTLTFEEWRKDAGMGEFVAPGDTEVRGIFVNRLDLNLTRDHHSLLRSDPFVGVRLAAYVCNHPGPAPDPDADPTGLFTSPQRVDAAIDSVLSVDDAHPQGRNLLACVLMDRMPLEGIPRADGTRDRIPTNEFGEEFTRFLVFGPNGQLLPSVNLDGQGEKFVPGVCTACHGGTNYFVATGTRAPGVPNLGGYPETTTSDPPGLPDLKSYFLPYDVDNLQFRSSNRNLTKDQLSELSRFNLRGLTRQDQEKAIFELNSNANEANNLIAFLGNRLSFEVGRRFSALFEGFYPENGPPFNSDYVASAYQSDLDPERRRDNEEFYRNVVARSCRTCHIAMDDANFESVDPAIFPSLSQLVCDVSPSTATPGTVPTLFTVDAARAYQMPNSRVTFDRFWLSDRTGVPGQPEDTPKQLDILRRHLTAKNRADVAARCVLPP